MIPPQVTSFKYRHFAGGLRRLESSLWDNPLVLALPTVMSGPAPDEHPSRTKYACHFAHDYLLSGAIHNLAPSTDSRSGYKPVGWVGMAPLPMERHRPRAGKTGAKKRSLPVSRLLRRGSAKAKRPSISSRL